MWEKLKSPFGQDNLEGEIHRTKVPGGWLVVTIWWGCNLGGVAQTFLPDPEREWKPEKDPVS